MRWGRVPSQVWCERTPPQPQEAERNKHTRTRTSSSFEGSKRGIAGWWDQRCSQRDLICGGGIHGVQAGLNSAGNVKHRRDVAAAFIPLWSDQRHIVSSTVFFLFFCCQHQ